MAKNWTPEAAAAAIRLTYRRVLERDVDDSGLITYAGQLDRGERPLREIIRDIGKSPEYRDRFVTPFTMKHAARLMYLHFLAREPENEQVIDAHAAGIAQNGWQSEIDAFVNSDEYRNRFGNDAVPA